MIIALLALLGLVFGSFVNAFVWRLHEQEELWGKKKRPSNQQLAKLSILKGRSMCPSCKHELAAKDLVPVLSWLSLRGRCRYCHKPISWQYPLVELATALLFVTSYIWWPVALNGVGLTQFVFWLVFVVAFMALTIYDVRWFLLPNRVVYPLICLAIVEVIVVSIVGRDFHSLLNAALGALIIAGIFYILFQLSGGAWIGGGDVKLAVVLGLLAGTPVKALLVMFFSSVIGTICSIPILLRGKKALGVQVPFGPFLLAATVVVVLFGTAIVDWYTGHFLL
jgi:leader peptidase (prepilin peptidase)/N-methyltransferase